MRPRTLAIDVAALVLGAVQPTHLAVCTIRPAVHAQTVPRAVVMVECCRPSTVRTETTVVRAVTVEPIHRVNTVLLLSSQTTGKRGSRQRDEPAWHRPTASYYTHHNHPKATAEATG